MIKQLKLLLICSICFNCNTSDTIQKRTNATEYLDKVNDIHEAVVPTSTQFSEYFQFVAPIAKNGTNFQLDSNQIDSLRLYYANFMNSIKKAKESLSLINEYDPEFNIRKHILNHLNYTEHSYAYSIPTYLIIYKIGWAQANDSLKNIIETSSSVLHDDRMKMIEESTALEKERTEFMRKYKITY